MYLNVFFLYFSQELILVVKKMCCQLFKRGQTSVKDWKLKIQVVYLLIKDCNTNKMNASADDNELCVCLLLNRISIWELYLFYCRAFFAFIAMAVNRHLPLSKILWNHAVFPSCSDNIRFFLPLYAKTSCCFFPLI